MGVLQVGVFNEEGFRRLDSILAAAATYNVYVILPFVNYWPDLGGVQWYVDQVGHRAHRGLKIW